MFQTFKKVINNAGFYKTLYGVSEVKTLLEYQLVNFYGA